MGIYDRDWYRDEVRRREGRDANVRRGSAGARSGDRTGGTSGLTVKVVVLVVLMAAAAAVAHDMKARGVPFTWHGFKWWLSLWV
ncbi:MAG: hypothetical protein HXY24_05435 [Rubrivivax sp.]|nr:hypothetical protein [Rubrivivax sp.]